MIVGKHQRAIIWAGRNPFTSSFVGLLVSVCTVRKTRVYLRTDLASRTLLSAKM